MPFLLSKKSTKQAMSNTPNMEPITIPTTAPAGNPCFSGVAGFKLANAFSSSVNFLSVSVVRLNFLWGFNSLEALKMIRAEDLLMKMFNNYPSEYQEKMRYVFEAAKTILDNRINEMEKKIN